MEKIEALVGEITPSYVVPLTTGYWPGCSSLGSTSKPAATWFVNITESGLYRFNYLNSSTYDDPCISYTCGQGPPFNPIAFRSDRTTLVAYLLEGEYYTGIDNDAYFEIGTTILLEILPVDGAWYKRSNNLLFFFLLLL